MTQKATKHLPLSLKVILLLLWKRDADIRNIIYRRLAHTIAAILAKGMVVGECYLSRENCSLQYVRYLGISSFPDIDEFRAANRHCIQINVQVFVYECQLNYTIIFTIDLIN